MNLFLEIWFHCNIFLCFLNFFIFCSIRRRSKYFFGFWWIYLDRKILFMFNSLILKKCILFLGNIIWKVSFDNKHTVLFSSSEIELSSELELSSSLELLWSETSSRAFDVLKNKKYESWWKNQNFFFFKFWSIKTDLQFRKNLLTQNY